MVKNSGGGNKSKGQARKNITASGEGGGGRLRRADEEGEIYAQVAALLGGDGCYVTTLAGRRLFCVIRGSFRGRNKRSNIITVGSWVLVGLRDWESADAAKPKCDLLEVYQASDKARLRAAEPTLNWSAFNEEVVAIKGAPVEDDGIDFQNETNAEYEMQITAEIRGGVAVSETIQLGDGEEITIDDI